MQEVCARADSPSISTSLGESTWLVTTKAARVVEGRDQLLAPFRRLRGFVRPGTEHQHPSVPV